MISKEENPLVVANNISYFISDALRESSINLYEAFLLNGEEIRFRRMGYLSSAWNGRVRSSTCITILNQKLLACLFGEQIYAEKLKEWGLEVYDLIAENKNHYILQQYRTYIDACHFPELLKELRIIRENYNNLSDDNGPYHNEVFPYDFYSPEELLLEYKGKRFIKKSINSDIEGLIVNLSN